MAGGVAPVNLVRELIGVWDDYCRRDLSVGKIGAFGCPGEYAGLLIQMT